MENAIPSPLLAPAIKALSYGQPGTKTFREFAPCGACLHHPQDGFQQRTTFGKLVSRPRFGQQWTNPLPVVRCQIGQTQQPDGRSGYRGKAGSLASTAQDMTAPGSRLMDPTKMRPPQALLTLLCWLP